MNTVSASSFCSQVMQDSLSLTPVVCEEVLSRAKKVFLREQVLMLPIDSDDTFDSEGMTDTRTHDYISF